MAKYRPEERSRQVAPPRATIRLDKWLWQARFFRSRPMACEMIAEGYLRLNGQHCLKAGHQVGEGDTLTFPQGGRIRLIRVLGPGTRRGPASEAQGLYLDLDPQSNLPEGLDAERDFPDDPENENEICDSRAKAAGGIPPRSSALE